MLHGRQKILNPGDLLVFDPECASGWMDKVDGVCDLLVWIWRTPPRCGECRPSMATYRQWMIGSKLWERLEQLHGLCRQEVEHPDKLTGIALEHLHLAMDIAVARLVRRRSVIKESTYSSKRILGNAPARVRERR